MALPLNKILCGDNRKVMPGFPDESINCCISSPPFWALRDYGLEPQIWDGDKNCTHNFDLTTPPRRCRNENDVINLNSKQASVGGSNYNATNSQFCSLCGAWRGSLGLEPTFELYIKHLCDIYDEVYRVLRKDGTCWVNLGDTYSSTPAGNKIYETQETTHCSDGSFKVFCPKPQCNIPAKSLCCIPDRFRIEMLKRGWILRNKIIWSKPNPMPSSSKDRFTVDFEDVMFFVKNNATLYWIRPDGKMVARQPDYKAGIEGLDWQWGVRKGKRVKLSLWQGQDYFFEPQYEPTIEPYSEKRATRPETSKMKAIHSSGKPAGNYTYNKLSPLGRNKRTTWIIPTQPTPEAHFATFPENLVRPMVRAGCPRYVCKKCGLPRVKIYETEYREYKGSKQQAFRPRKEITKDCPDNQFGTMRYAAVKSEHYFKGYTDCGCNAGWTPGVVLDPFAARAGPARLRSRRVAIISGLILKASMSSDLQNRTLRKLKAA